jgi:hypothetical protein
MLAMDRGRSNGELGTGGRLCKRIRGARVKAGRLQAGGKIIGGRKEHKRAEKLQAGGKITCERGEHRRAVRSCGVRMRAGCQNRRHTRRPKRMVKARVGQQ